MRITLDTGTTTLEVARAIIGIKNLTVLTSSLVIASTLYPYDNIELVLLGGTVRQGNPDLSGWLTEENLKRFRVDMAILGADGADRNGIYTSDVNVARISQSMILSAKHVVSVMDHRKFQQPSFVQFSGWDDIHHVITDTGTPANIRKWLNNKTGKVTYAK
jgi:DeoR/GlpR family transcriptional regulator of sugar metabolism